MTILRGPRLALRELQPEDWRAVHSYSILDAVVRYQPWGPNTEDESRAFVAAAIGAARGQPRLAYHLAIEEATTRGVIGIASLIVAAEKASDDSGGEMGYFLHPDAWGRGYATEAAGLLMRFAFEELLLNRLIATCDPRNTASARVLEKAGLRHVRRDRRTMEIRDGWRDSDVYALERSGWHTV